VKAYLPKNNVSEEVYTDLVENKQILVSIKEIDEKRQLLKVTPLAEE